MSNYCWLQDLTLLEQKRGWLNDQLINVGQMLLKKQVHHYRWFAKRWSGEDSQFCPKQWSIRSNLNTFNSHWICVTTLGCEPNSVDSMRCCVAFYQGVYHHTPELSVPCNLFSLYNVPQVQQQTDTASCGLFALAFAYTFCEGLDPSQMEYKSVYFDHIFYSV